MTYGAAALPGGAQRARPAVVGIGASAGGVEAFRGFFKAMPPDSGMAFVVVLHLPPDAPSQLPEILGRWTSMRVVEAEEGCAVEANCVYVPPAGIVVTFSDGRLHPHRPVGAAPRAPKPIDLFFGSLATALGEDAVGVVLSGTGSDGALGLKAIKARGGLTLAQGEGGSSPQHDGMPTSAIATGAVDIVASVEAMPAHIVSIHAARQAPGEMVELAAAQADAARRAICDVLHRQLGHDFRGYKENTFLRRVRRRLQVLGLADLAQYAARLDGDPAEVATLFRDLLIGVTSFFRDPETFEALRRAALPLLFEGRGPTATVRCWVPGCATGEEAYSLAMLLRERADALGAAAPRLQVFATDIDERAIAAARQGRYVSTQLQGVSPERLARFFVDNGDGSHTAARSVRDICTFSTHSLTRDPPFSRIDLLSCRNLLIYLDAELQSVVMPVFHYALAAGGVLLLGGSEGIARQEDLFATLDRGHRIFQRRPGHGPPPRLVGRTGGRELTATRGAGASPAMVQAGAAARMHGRAKARILDRFAPAFVVVAADGEIVQYSSRVGRFLEPAAGAPGQNVLAMVRGGLRAPLAAALRQAAQTERPVQKPDLALALAEEGAQRVTLTVEPLTEPGNDPLYLVVFAATGQWADQPTVRAEESGLPTEYGQQMEAELRETHEQLQSMTEEHEAALEELRGANEELHSLNEEAQSTNEELETSKEEIQSVNEELRTVNQQLAGKLAELDDRNSDLRTLFDSTEVATIFLDAGLVVRSFTPAVAGIYNLIASDVGRKLTDIASRVRYDGLAVDVGRVLAGLQPLERRVAREDGAAHYLMRLLPYRTPDGAVGGALVTFVDVTSIELAERQQKLLVDELNHRVRNMLAVVASLASQTMRRSRTMAEFSEDYLGRIQALAAASLLAREGWRTVPLRDVIVAELKPFLAGDRMNVVVEGPPVPLQPRAVLALGMAVHELVTNAVKHGALSVPEGNVHVLWHVDARADGDWLALDWTECHGPAVAAPTQRGFGLALIEHGLRQDMDAQVTVDFAATGVSVTVRAPLSPQRAGHGAA